MKSESIPAPMKREVVERDGLRCWYCGVAFSDPSYQLHLDHLLPSVRGGKSSVDNLVVSCFVCNTRKSDRDVEEFRALIADRTGAKEVRFYGEGERSVGRLWAIASASYRMSQGRHSPFLTPIEGTKLKTMIRSNGFQASFRTLADMMRQEAEWRRELQDVNADAMEEVARLLAKAAALLVR